MVVKSDLEQIGSLMHLALTDRKATELGASRLRGSVRKTYQLAGWTHRRI